MCPPNVSPPELFLRLSLLSSTAAAPPFANIPCFTHKFPASYASLCLQTSSLHTPFCLQHHICPVVFQQPNSNPTPTSSDSSPASFFPRKEVIQPHLPIRLPCYDFTPVTKPAFGGFLLSVGSPTSGISGSHGVTGGVYKTRERIHRYILICDY